MRSACWKTPLTTRPLSVSAQVIVLVALVVAAYLNSFDGAFQFDDYRVIVDNPRVHSWSAWRASMPGIRPLLKGSYTLSWTAGTGTAAFHAFNLLCHFGSTLLVFALLRRFTRPPSAMHGLPVLFAALVFALHPAQTEAVTYISGRSVSFMAVCYLGAVFAYVEGREHNRPWLHAVLSPLLFVAAMLVKETAWTLPFALLLWERLQRQAAWRDAAAPLARHFAVLAALVLASPDYRYLLGASLATRPPLENLAAQIHGVFYLITRPLLGLQMNSDPQVSLDVPLMFTAAKAGVLACLLWLGFHQWRQRPWLAFGILWFFLHLLPTNSLIARLDPANDRQLYLALMGPAWIAAHSLVAVPRSAARSLGIAVMALLAAATIARNLDYRDAVRFWQAAVQASPAKARPWNNLGYALQTAGRTDARAAYQRALALDPAQVQAGVNLRLLIESRESEDAGK